MKNIFFDSWESILRTFVIGVTAYSGLIFLLRISGKRTLSKMNAFDFIVTIALGSTLATVLLNKNVALADGFLALALLIFLQYSITWLSVRFKWTEKLVKSTPTLLYYKGKFLEPMMKKERITREEILASIRQHGKGSIEAVDAVILETNGRLSVLGNIQNNEKDILMNVQKTIHKQ